MKTTNIMEHLLRRGVELVVKDMRLGDDYYEVNATYWGEDLNRPGHLLVRFEGHLMSVPPGRVTFRDDTKTT